MKKQLLLLIGICSIISNTTSATSGKEKVKNRLLRVHFINALVRGDEHDLRNFFKDEDWPA